MKDFIIWILTALLAIMGTVTYEIATSPANIKVVGIQEEAKPTPVPTLKPVATPTPTCTPIPSPTPTLEAIAGQSEFKTYERYTAITRKDSDQYKLQQIAYTGDYGIRMVEDRYCVALGSRWSTKIGEKLDVIMQDGTVIKVILGDCKQDRHTDPTNTWGLDNRDILEFIVDVNEIPATVRRCGSFNEIFKGKVADIIKAE